MREITVATVQMEPKLGQMEDNLIKMGEFITRIATEQPVDLIVFPELVTTGYEAGPRFPHLAQRIPGPTVNLIAQRASELGVHVAFGMVSKEKVESILYNTAVLVGPDGELIDQYHKVHLRGEEQIAFRAGYRLGAIETSFGIVGMMVGWDLAFPEVARRRMARLSAGPSLREWGLCSRCQSNRRGAFVHILRSQWYHWPGRQGLCQR